MKSACSLFQVAHVAADSPLILCFRELGERLARGQQVDVRQVDHMAGWLRAKVEQYGEAPSHLQALQPVFDAAREGWELLLEGVYCLAAYLEEGQEALLEEAFHLAEDGEDLLQQLEEAIVAERDPTPVCDGYLS